MQKSMMENHKNSQNNSNELNIWNFISLIKFKLLIFNIVKFGSGIHGPFHSSDRPSIHFFQLISAKISFVSYLTYASSDKPSPIF